MAIIFFLHDVVHEICFELTKQISVSLRGNPNGFPLAAAYFRAHRKEMPRLHPFRKPRCRQMGVRCAKASFCLRESSLGDFVLSCQNKIFRLEGRCPLRRAFLEHTVENARRIHPLRRSRANCVARRKSAVLLARIILEWYPQKSSSILFGSPVLFRSPLVAGGQNLRKRA